jgi:hypothetical protein
MQYAPVTGPDAYAELACCLRDLGRFLDQARRNATVPWPTHADTAFAEWLDGGADDPPPCCDGLVGQLATYRRRLRQASATMTAEAPDLARELWQALETCTGGDER